MVLWAVSLVMALYTDFTLSLHDNLLEGGSTYFLSLTSVMSLLFACKAVGRLPFVSYFGRYSMIPLCVHHMIYRPVSVVLGRFDASVPWLVALITVLLCWAAIPLCRRFIPWFVAQKDLIRVE